VDILETLYEKPPSLLRFQERKVHIESANTLLLGPSGAGKTTLILDFLSTLKTASYLYIDAKDLRLEGNLNGLDLGSFYHQNNLELLAIDNYCDCIILPDGCNLLLSSCDLSLHVKGLKTLRVDYLDFEEFIAFGKGSVSPQHMFNLFANHGRHPGAVHLQDSSWIEYLQNQLRLHLPSQNALTLFKQMAHFQSKPLSLHRLYSELKKDMKISKDTLYEKALLFEQHSLIHFIPKWQAPKTPKKSKSKKVLLFVLVIIIAVAVLLFLLFRNLSQTNKTIHNNPLSENSGLENLIEDEPEIEDEYLLEEEPNPNISNEEEDLIINNNKEVDISVLDSDGDGLTDYQETEIWGTDPYNPDTDGDGYSDFDEIKAGYNPLGDGLLE